MANDRIRVQRQQQATTARRRTTQQPEASKEELRQRAVALYEKLCREDSLILTPDHFNNKAQKLPDEL